MNHILISLMYHSRVINPTYDTPKSVGIFVIIVIENYITMNDNKKLLLIPNSKNLLDNKLGYFIDNCPFKICRFNLYEIEGFEDSVGNRTDYIIQRACDDIPKRPPHSIEHCFLFITYCNLSNIMRKVARDYERWYGQEKTTIIDVNQTYKTHLKLGLEYGKKASIGILAIDYFLSEDYNITLFNWQLSGNLQPNHYFRRQPLDSHFHNFEKESNYINSLVEEEKINIWNPME